MLKIARAAHHTCFPLACCLALGVPSLAQEQLPAPVVYLSPASLSALPSEEKALYLQAVTAHWNTSADGRDFAFLQAAVDPIVAPDGTLRIPVDQALPFGRTLLLLYRVTQNPMDYKASRQLRDSLQLQQDKADISAAPFLADFGVTFQELPAADQASSILLRVDTADRDLETGLLHGSGEAVNLYRNTMYANDLEQTIDRLPIGYHHRRGLTEALNKTVSALIARHDNHEVWQTPGQPPQSVLLDAYLVAHGVRLGSLAQGDASFAQRMADASHPAADDAATIGARLLLQSEVEQVSTQAYGQGKTVTVDAWFNARTRVNAAGNKELYDYKWDDDSDHGFSFFGHAFQRYGVQLDTLRVAPTAATLSPSQIYVIIPPNGPAKDASMHTVTKADADAIEAWVKEGGVVALMIGDLSNQEMTPFENLADRFGMHFNAAQKKPVPDANYQQGAIEIPAGTNVFSKPHHAFMAATGTLRLGPQAHAVVKEGNDTIVAAASIGRGTVLAVANPWLYNEYTDGRKLPPSFDNFAAGIDLAAWLLKQTQ